MRVLSVCTGNTCRSPMLTAALQIESNKLNLSAVFEGAGVGQSAATNLSAAEHAQTCFPGLLEEHKSTHISKRVLKDYDIILCLTEGHKNGVMEEIQKQQGAVSAEDEAKVRVFPGGMPDPVGGPLEEYQSCAAQCREWAQLILKETMSKS
eukprot:2129554-Rhodomonas_salina.4